MIIDISNITNGQECSILATLLYVDVNATSIVKSAVRKALRLGEGEFCNIQNIGYDDNGVQVRRDYHYYEFPYLRENHPAYKILLELHGKRVKDHGVWLGCGLRD